MLSANSSAFKRELTAIGVCGTGTEEDPLQAIVGVISELQLQQIKVLCIKTGVHLNVQYMERSAHISPQRVNL